MHSRFTAFFLTAAIAVSIVSNPGLAQSGRGRPKVPTREPSAPPPPPPKIPASVEVVKQEQIRNTYRFQLKNGITVILTERHSYPLVAATATFKAGSDDDPEGQAGMAALIQQVLLAGPAAISSDQFNDRLRAAGIVTGASSDLVTSSYSFVSGPAVLKESIQLQASLFQDPGLRQSDIDRE